MDFLPQEPFTQAFGGTHSLSVVQIFTQLSPAHRKGAQSICPGGWQAPAPSQVPAVFSLLAAHLAAMPLAPPG